MIKNSFAQPLKIIHVIWDAYITESQQCMHLKLCSLA